LTAFFLLLKGRRKWYVLAVSTWDARNVPYTILKVKRRGPTARTIRRMVWSALLLRNVLKKDVQYLRDLTRRV
jgi:hypothetical protein